MDRANRPFILAGHSNFLFCAMLSTKLRAANVLALGAASEKRTCCPAEQPRMEIFGQRLQLVAFVAVTQACMGGLLLAKQRNDTTAIGKTILLT